VSFAAGGEKRNDLFAFAILYRSFRRAYDSNSAAFVGRRCLKEIMKPKRTILCVDDSEQSLSIRKVMLETRGYRVITCADGVEALEHFRKGGIDLVLTDLVMPNMAGDELARQVKELSPQTPVILFSGKVKVNETESQADVFLPKGMYAPAELLERIRLLLVRKRGPKRVSFFSIEKKTGT
jgi:DNA-binding response OmpR family regulator